MPPRKLKPFSEFITLVKSECKKHDVEFRHAKGRFVTTAGTKVGGYFGDKPKKILAVAQKGKDYKTTLAHEYCHLTQWVDKLVLWDLCENSSIKLDEWLNGKRVDDIKVHIDIVRSLELDNEQRTAKLMDEYDFGLTKEQYTQTANAYLMFHNWLLITRRWSKVGNAASVNPRIILEMSENFDMDYSKLTPRLRRIFKEENI